MSDQRPLPELTEGPLSADALAQLFADIAACADGVEVRLKAAAARRADAATTTLSEARDALLSGRARRAGPVLVGRAGLDRPPDARPRGPAHLPDGCPRPVGPPLEEPC